jgi:hypothetical protein
MASFNPASLFFKLNNDYRFPFLLHRNFEGNSSPLCLVKLVPAELSNKNPEADNIELNTAYLLLNTGYPFSLYNTILAPFVRHI